MPERFREQPPLSRDFGGPQRDFGRPSEFWIDGPREAMEGGPSSMKRKFPEEDEFAWHRQHISQYGNSSPSLNPNLDRSQMRRYDDDLRASKQVRLDGGDGYGELPGRRGRRPEDLAPAGPAVVDVDPQALKRAFLKFAKTINENAAQRENYLEDGKDRPLQCNVCGRFDFISLLIMICTGNFWVSIAFAYCCGVCAFSYFLDMNCQGLLGTLLAYVNIFVIWVNRLLLLMLDLTLFFLVLISLTYAVVYPI